MSASEANPRRAIALRYDRGERGDAAPVVAATGGGDVADAILRLAEAHDVPIVEDVDLLRCLSVSDVGRPIPVEAWLAVAEILAFLYARNAELLRASTGPPSDSDDLA